MEPETIAGHRYSDRRTRFSGAATLFLVLCGLNATVYLYVLANAISSGQPVSILESHDPNVISLKGQHARVDPEVYSRLQTYGRVTGALFVLSFVLRLSLIAVNARLPASASPEPGDELGPVRIAADGVAHAGGGQWPVILPRDRIERLELEYRPVADRPLPMVLFGVLFMLFGLPLVILLPPRIQNFEMFAVCCLGALLLGMGVWMIWLAFKKRYVLVAHTPGGPSMLVFHRRATREKVIRFATGAAKRHDYQLDFGQGLAG
jgi:hypothetical protein